MTRRFAPHEGSSEGTPLFVRAPFFILGLFAVSCLCGRAGAQGVGSLTGIARLSPTRITAGTTIRYSATFSVAVSSVTLYLSDPSGNLQQLVGVRPVSGTAITLASDVGWVNGTYTVAGVFVSPVNGPLLIYQADGQFSSASDPNAPPRHSLDFSTQGFELSGGIDVRIPPVLTAVTRTTPAVIASGDTTTFALNYLAGNTPLAFISIAVSLPGGVQRQFTIRPAAPPSPNLLSMAMTTDWPTGNYTIDRVNFQDTSNRFTMYLANGTVVTSPELPGTPGSHAINLAPLSFRVEQSAWLANLAVRAALADGQNLIVGVVPGSGARDVLVRVAGPALRGFGLASAMVDPRLELFRDDTSILTNDDWPAALAPTFGSVGAFPFAAGSKDAALVRTLAGPHSIHCRGTAPGVMLVEAYDLAPNTGGLVNVSARARVGAGDDTLIVGFTVAGRRTKKLLVRAIGPKLAAFGVTGFLADPKLEVYDAGGTKLTENDNWTSGLSSVRNTFTAVGAFALDPGSADSAVIVTYPVGNYTAVVRGVNGTTGEALVEVYEIP